MDDVIRNVPVTLTQDEFEQRAAELAAVNQELEALDRNRKAAASGFKGQIEKAQGRLSKLVLIVAKRAEYRDVNCSQRINPDAKIVEIVRSDTGEIVDTRALTSQDLQDSLIFLNEQADRPEPGEPGDGEEKT